MQVKVEEISPVKRKISIEVPVERVNDEIHKAYTGIQKKATLSGFRKGKAPMQMVKKFYRGTMQDEVMKRLYEETLFPALEKHKIEPVDAPLIDDMELVTEDEPFKYSAMIEVMPRILLTDYKGLNVKKERYVEDENAVKAEIERMRQNMAQLIPVEDEDGEVEKGMVLTVDYSSSVSGNPEEDSNGKDVTIDLSTGDLISGLEDGLIGMRIGESKSIDVTLPENSKNKEIAGKPGIFSVTLKEIKRKELPDLDDEFAQQFGDFETLDEMKAKLAEMREKQELDRIQNELKAGIIDALIEKNPLEVPESMVRRQLDFMLENFKNSFKGQKLSLEMMGFNEDTFRKRFWDEAVRKVKGGLLVMALVEQENIVVEQTDLEARYAEIAADNEDMIARIEEFYKVQTNARNSMIAEIKEDKAIDFLIKHAVITEFEPSEMNDGE